MRSAATFLRSVLTLTLLAALAAPGPVRGQGVTIFPKRLVFTGPARSAEVTLVNQGAQPVTYRIELVDRRMTAAGVLEEIAAPSPEDRSARAWVHYSPRQVTLPPGSAQTVRFVVARPTGLAPGEYRCHLLARALPPVEGAASDVEAPPQANALAVHITALVAISIPIIVRQGPVKATVSLSDLSLDPGDGSTAPSLGFHLNREGETSVYGELTASFLPGHGGPEAVVAVLKGVAIYPPLATTARRLPLAIEPGRRLSDGRLRLRFRSRPEDDGGAPEQVAEAEIALP
jgi:P pilus assembly chaperone PapD